LPAGEPTPARPLSTIWEIPDDLWEEIEPIIDCFYPPARTGRLRADLVHGWFQRFSADGFLEELWAYLVRECDEFGEVHWDWQAVDGVMGKSRFGGKKTGPNPTDRAKMGTKKSVQVAIVRSTTQRRAGWRAPLVRRLGGWPLPTLARDRRGRPGGGAAPVLPPPPPASGSFRTVS
jgi:hypothetical protein